MITDTDMAIWEKAERETLALEAHWHGEDSDQET